MEFVKILLFLLRLHMLLPPEHINHAGFLDTISILSLALAPWTFMILSIAYCCVYLNTASLAELTNVTITIFICIIVVSTNVILATKKFEIRSLLGEMREMVIQRKIQQTIFVKKKKCFVIFFPFFWKTGRSINDSLKQLYTTTDRRCNSLVQTFLIIYGITTSGVIFTPIIRAIHYWLIGQYPFDISFLPYQI